MIKQNEIYLQFLGKHVYRLKDVNRNIIQPPFLKEMCMKRWHPVIPLHTSHQSSRLLAFGTTNGKLNNVMFKLQGPINMGKITYLNHILVREDFSKPIGVFDSFSNVPDEQKVFEEAVSTMVQHASKLKVLNPVEGYIRPYDILEDGIILPDADLFELMDRFDSLFKDE